MNGRDAAILGAGVGIGLAASLLLADRGRTPRNLVDLGRRGARRGVDFIRSGSDRRTAPDQAREQMDRLDTDC